MMLEKVNTVHNYKISLAEWATLESGKPFPKDVTEKLEALYSRGMNGWENAHNSEIDVAMTSTGLKLSQIKVSFD